MIKNSIKEGEMKTIQALKGPNQICNFLVPNYVMIGDSYLGTIQ